MGHLLGLWDNFLNLLYLKTYEFLKYRKLAENFFVRIFSLRLSYYQHKLKKYITL